MRQASIWIYASTMLINQCPFRHSFRNWRFRLSSLPPPTLLSLEAFSTCVKNLDEKDWAARVAAVTDANGTPAFSADRLRHAVILKRALEDFDDGGLLRRRQRFAGQSNSGWQIESSSSCSMNCCANS